MKMDENNKIIEMSDAENIKIQQALNFHINALKAAGKHDSEELEVAMSLLLKLQMI